jgi:hypothetical protein
MKSIIARAAAGGGQHAAARVLDRSSRSSRPAATPFQSSGK